MKHKWVVLSDAEEAANHPRVELVALLEEGIRSIVIQSVSIREQHPTIPGCDVVRVGAGRAIQWGEEAGAECTALI